MTWRRGRAPKQHKPRQWRANDWQSSSQFGTAVKRKPAITPAQIPKQHFMSVPVAIEVRQRSHPANAATQIGAANAAQSAANRKNGRKPILGCGSAIGAVTFGVLVMDTIRSRANGW